ncbi:hypothetical protein [Paraburkholderia sp. GAS82]|uniref:hypothetical protein n=1 Tax=Paraburkholderia sp. GAS82 TaxID=3035137 RepID=UPI003D201539
MSEVQGSGNNAQLIDEIADAIQRNEGAMQTLQQAASQQGNGTAGADSSSASSTASQSGSGQAGEAVDEGNAISGAAYAEDGAGTALNSDVASSIPTSQASDSALGGDLGNGQPQPTGSIDTSNMSADTDATLTSGDAGNVGAGSAGYATSISSNSDLDSAARAAESSGGEDPNAGVLHADDYAAAGQQSYAGVASLTAGTEGANATASLSSGSVNPNVLTITGQDAEKGRLAIARIRKFLWSYNEPDVSHLHRELDTLAAIFG